MKKYFIFSLIITLIGMVSTGCRATKITDSVDLQLHDQSTTGIVQTHHEQTQSAGTTTIVSNEKETVVEETHTVVYDTSLPIDSTTGRPPVQSETTKRKTTAKGKAVAEQSQTSAAAAVADSTEAVKKNDIDLNVKAEHEKTPKKPAVAYWWYIIVTIAIAAGGFVLWKKWGWIKKIVQWFQ
jgi:uncharacterized protein YcfL